MKEGFYPNANVQRVAFQNIAVINAIQCIEAYPQSCIIIYLRPTHYVYHGAKGRAERAKYRIGLYTGIEPDSPVGVGTDRNEVVEWVIGYRCLTKSGQGNA